MQCLGGEKRGARLYLQCVGLYTTHFLSRGERRDFVQPKPTSKLLLPKVFSLRRRTGIIPYKRGGRVGGIRITRG